MRSGRTLFSKKVRSAALGGDPGAASEWPAARANMEEAMKGRIIGGVNGANTVRVTRDRKNLAALAHYGVGGDERKTSVMVRWRAQFDPNGKFPQFFRGEKWIGAWRAVGGPWHGLFHLRRTSGRTAGTTSIFTNGWIQRSRRGCSWVDSDHAVISPSQSCPRRRISPIPLPLCHSPIRSPLDLGCAATSRNPRLVRCGVPC